MMLDPLAEVRIRVFVPVDVGRCQFVMDILRHGERGKREKDPDDPQDESSPQQGKNGGVVQCRCHEQGDRIPEMVRLISLWKPIRNKPILATLSTGMDFRRSIR